MNGAHLVGDGGVLDADALSDPRVSKSVSAAARTLLGARLGRWAPFSFRGRVRRPSVFGRRRVGTALPELRQPRKALRQNPGHHLALGSRRSAARPL